MHNRLYTEVAMLWGRAIMVNAAAYFLCCLAWFLLYANRVEQYAPHYAIMIGKAISDVGIVWLCRIRGGVPLLHIEHKMLRVGFMFWVLAFLTMWQYQRGGGPVSGCVPILIFETAFAYACSGIIIGGSFYPTATAFVVTAFLQAIWPEVGSPILALGAPALFWVGWKYSRRRPLR